MASRNLTNQFIELRRNARSSSSVGGRLGSRDESERLRGQSGSLALQDTLLDGTDGSSSSGGGGGGGGGAGAGGESNWREMRGILPPQWVGRLEEVEERVAMISAGMSDLQKLHAERLKLTFGDEEEKEREIERMTADLTSGFRDAEGILKAIAKETKAGEQRGDMSQREIVVRKNMQSNMAKKLQTLSARFRQSQREYMTRLQSRGGGGSAAASLSFLSEEDRAVAATPDDGFTEAQQQASAQLSRTVEERQHEIENIAQSIEELSQIFRELAVLVIDQGTILDRIDYNMEQVVEHTRGGIVQLEKAEEYQKGALPLKCIVVLLCLIGLMIGILIYKNDKKD